MNAMLDSEADKELHQKVGPGSRLKEERERQQLPLDKVAAQLHLNNALITALEKDEYDKLPGVVFVRGYVRNYARFLGLSDDNLLEDLKHYYPDDNSPKLKVANAQGNKEVRSSHGLVRLVTWLMILSTIGMLGAWWWNRTANSLSVDDTVTAIEELNVLDQNANLLATEKTTMAAPTVARIPVSEEKLPVIEATAIETVNEKPENSSVGVFITESQKPEPENVVENNTDTEVVIQKTTEIVEETPAEESSEQLLASTTEGVVLSFSKACWIDIRDTASDYKMIGNFSSGSRTLQGKGPYKVIIGNIKAVTMAVNGKEYNLRQHTNKGNVAKFLLKLDKPKDSGEN